MSIDELLDKNGYAGEFLETRGRYTRVTAEEPDGSVWYCNVCDSVEGVDPYEERCDTCDDEEDSCDRY